MDSIIVFRTDEYIQVMRRLWSHGEASFSGTFVQLERVLCFPKPIQVPVIVGGHTEAAAARAGRIGDGFYPAAPPDRVAELVRTMKRSAENAGRDPAAIEITAGAGPNYDVGTVRRYQDAGVARVMVGLPAQNPADLLRCLGILHVTLISKVS